MSKNTFDTPDLGLAAYLHCKGVKVISVEKIKMQSRDKRVTFGERMAFLFENKNDTCQQYELEYTNDGIVVARLYNESVRALKTMIKSKKYNPTKEEQEILDTPHPDKDKE